MNYSIFNHDLCYNSVFFIPTPYDCRESRDERVFAVRPFLIPTPYFLLLEKVGMVGVRADGYVIRFVDLIPTAP